MYQEVEHTADCAIQVTSPDLAGLFLHAARGMYALTGGKVAAGVTDRRVCLTAPDAETLLVEWLEELAFLLETAGEMASEIDIHLLKPTDLNARLRTGPAAQVTKLIKAVTFHGLEIRSSAEGYQATIVFDV